MFRRRPPRWSGEITVEFRTTERNAILEAIDMHGLLELSLGGELGSQSQIVVVTTHGDLRHVLEGVCKKLCRDDRVHDAKITRDLSPNQKGAAPCQAS